MKITKRQLRRIIKEEKAKILSEAELTGPAGIPWKIEYRGSKVFAVGMDPDTWETDDPLEIELDPVKLLEAIDSGSLDLGRKKHTPAGSMPWSKSPVNPKSPNYGK